MVLAYVTSLGMFPLNKEMVLTALGATLEVKALLEAMGQPSWDRCAAH